MGLLIVTIPNQEIETEIDFEYWLDEAYVKSAASSLYLSRIT